MTESDEPSEATLAILSARLSEVRERRVQAEKAGRKAGPLQVAIDAVVRDRDAGTSDEIEQLRERAVGLAGRLVAALGSINETRILTARLDAAGLPTAELAARKGLEELLGQDRAFRRLAREQLSAGGLVWLTIPEALTPDFGTHPEPTAVRNVLRQRDAVAEGKG